MSQEKISFKIQIHLVMLGFLFILFAALALFYGRPVIQNDGISYYALTSSLLEDHDFDLKNEHQKHREVRVIPQPGSDKVASYYSAGVAFLYAPFLYITDLFQGLREWRPYAQNVRFPFSHNFGFFAGSVFYAFLSVALAYFILIRHQEVSPVAGMLLSVSCFVGTPLIFYAFTVPSFVHSSDTFLVTAAFLLTISENRLEYGTIRFRNVLLGFVLALSIFLRNNNIVIVPVLVLGVVFLEWEEGTKNAARTCLEVFAGALPILLIHSYFNFVQYGKPFATGYTVNVSQHVKRRAFRFFWIFFHPVPGIYPWSPVAFLGTIGLILAALRKRKEALIAVGVVAVVIVSIRFAAIIFPGSTFGQRLLTHLYVFWAFGLAELFIRSKKILSLLTVACVLWTFLLFNMYFILTGARESKIMTKEGGASPIEWIQTSVEAYEKAKNQNEVTNPVEFWYRNLGAKPYPVLLHILTKRQTL